MKDEQLYQRAVALEETLTGIVDKISAGQGTVGQLLTNSQLFDSLNAATGELHSLMKDVRANPKKFLTIQLKIF
jgi:phospholipid/cholesterol/gamma-HCH transport system substrate-binding protein